MSMTARRVFPAALVAASIALAWLASSSAVAVRAAAPLFDAVVCDMSQYKAAAGMTASMDQNVLTVAWNGQNGSEMRTRYAIDSGQPLVRELAVRKAGGQWVTLGQNLT